MEFLVIFFFGMKSGLQVLDLKDWRMIYNHTGSSSEWTGTIGLYRYWWCEFHSISLGFGWVQKDFMISDVDAMKVHVRKMEASALQMEVWLGTFLQLHWQPQMIGASPNHYHAVSCKTSLDCTNKRDHFNSAQMKSNESATNLWNLATKPGNLNQTCQLKKPNLPHIGIIRWRPKWVQVSRERHAECHKTKVSVSCLALGLLWV